MGKRDFVDSGQTDRRGVVRGHSNDPFGSSKTHCCFETIIIHSFLKMIINQIYSYLTLMKNV